MNIILTLLEGIFPSSMAKSARNFVLTLIRTLLVVMSVNLMELSRAMSTTEKTLSAMRRIQRLPGLKLFSCTAVGLAIVSSLPVGRKYILTMDRTLWKLGRRVYNILATGICYDGISITIYFTAYDKDGTSDFTEQIAFIEHVLCFAY